MAGIDSLNHRVDRIRASLPISDAYDLSQLNLFSDEEQKIFYGFISSCATFTHEHTVSIEFRNLTAEQLDKLKLWAMLHNAIAANDAVEASSCREQLGLPFNQL